VRENTIYRDEIVRLLLEGDILDDGGMVNILRRDDCVGVGFFVWFDGVNGIFG